MNTENLIELYLTDNLYQELFATEADTYEEDRDPVGKQRLAKSLIEAQKEFEGVMWRITIDEDTLLYLFNIALPEYLEMWYSWGSEEGCQLHEDAQLLMSKYNVYYPY